MINLELPKPLQDIRTSLKGIAETVFRPISRKYDEEEHVFPKELEVLGVDWVNDETNERIAVEGIKLPFLLPPRGIGSLGQSVSFESGSAPQEGLWRMEVSVRMLNRPWVQRVQAITSYAPLAGSPVPKSSIAEQLKRHSFLSLEKDSTQLIISAGQWLIEAPLIVPPGYSLRVEAGATLKFSENSILLVHGTLQVAGVSGSPVVFEAATDRHWPGLVVMRAKEESVVDYLLVKDTSGVVYDDWALTGGVNFYESDVQISNSRFLDSHGEDALNIIHSRFEIRDSLIKGTASDAFDADFSVGSVTGSKFQDVGKAGGGDAIDVSGSQITVIDSEFLDVSDKALSVGEKSQMTARNIKMQRVGTGAASKDGSKLSLADAAIDDATFAGLTAYIKKPEYGPARIEAMDVAISNTETPALAQTGSSVSIDGQELATTDVDVDALYETVMRKGLR
jgi:hypothetical protein